MESNHPSGGLLRPAGFEDRKDTASPLQVFRGRTTPLVPLAAGYDLLPLGPRARCVAMAAGYSSGRRPEGITVRHARGCPIHEGGACECRPSYQAQAPVIVNRCDHRALLNAVVRAT